MLNRTSRFSLPSHRLDPTAPPRGAGGYSTAAGPHGRGAGASPGGAAPVGQVSFLYRPALCLFLVARLLAEQGKEERAVEVYALVTRYPYVANSCWYRDLVGQRIAEVAAALPPDVVTAAQERGRGARPVGHGGRAAGQVGCLLTRRSKRHILTV